METTQPFHYFLKWVFLIIFGAFVGALIKSRRGETKGVVDVLMLTLIGGFTGYLAYLGGNVYITDESALCVVVGCFAVLGQEALQTVIGYVQKKLQKSLEETTPKI